MTAHTEGSVTVTAIFADDVRLQSSLYRIDDGEWQNYSSAGVTVSKNATVHFKATDYADNIAEAQYEVTNIVKFVTNTVAGEDGSFDEAFAHGGKILFNTSNTTYNYTDGLVATDSMQIVGNGAAATTLAGGILYLDGNDASFSDLTLDGYVFGGGSGTSSVSASLNFSGVKFSSGNRIYGGADVAGSTAAKIGDITIGMEDVNGSGTRIFGAGRVADNATLYVGNIDVSIVRASGGTFTNYFAGAEALSGFSGSFVCEEVYSEVDEGEFTYCGNGSQLRDGESFQDDSVLFIKSGTFNHYVYAGGFSAGGFATVNGDTSLLIRGGTFNAHVFGGCGASNSANGEYTLVTGNSEVIVDTMENVITFNGNIYAGNMGSGHVNGETSLTFKGFGDKLLFEADSYVSGNSQMFKGSVPYVDGDKSLVFEEFMGDFGANINNTFSRLVADGSQVAFTGGKVALGSVASWEIEVVFEDAELDLGNAKNNFTGDTLSITLADGVELGGTPWDVITGTGTSLKGWDAFSKVTLCGTEAEFFAAAGEWRTGDYRLFRDGDTLKLAALA